MNVKFWQNQTRGDQLSVAQSCTPSVSAEIVASREDFSDAPGARRLRRFNVQDIQAPFRFHRLRNLVRRSGVNAALLGLWLRRGALYRRFAICGTMGSSARAARCGDWPTASRRCSAARRTRNQRSADFSPQEWWSRNMVAELSSAWSGRTFLRNKFRVPRKSARPATISTDTDRLQICATRQRCVLTHIRRRQHVVGTYVLVEKVHRSCAGPDAPQGLQV